MFRVLTVGYISVAVAVVSVIAFSSGASALIAGTAGVGDAGRFIQRPGITEASSRSTSSSAALFAATTGPFHSDGGIMLEEHRGVPSPNPATAVVLGGRPASFASDGGLMLQEAKPTPKAYLPPPVAAASGTRGQSFASYRSDGGIMMVQDVPPPRVTVAAAPPERVTPPTAGAEKPILESSPGGHGDLRLMAGYWVQREIDFVL